MGALPYDPLADGVRLRVRLTPNASRDALGAVALDAEGVAWLTATVTTVPENGRANKALIKLLAKSWKLPKSSMEVRSGATQRRKTLSIAGNGADLAKTIDLWLEKAGN